MDFEEIKEIKNPYTRVDYNDWYYAIERAGSVTTLADNSDYDYRMFNVRIISITKIMLNMLALKKL